jgi:hypothetical protein
LLLLITTVVCFATTAVVGGDGLTTFVVTVGIEDAAGILETGLDSVFCLVATVAVLVVTCCGDCLALVGADDVDEDVADVGCCLALIIDAVVVVVITGGLTGADLDKGACCCFFAVT